MVVRVAITILVCALASIADAAPGDFFSSSKPLSQSHAHLDDAARCNDCHVNGTRDTSNKQCLDCHDHQDLRARIQAGKGYHASAEVKGKQCATCHKEHYNRSFDIRGWKAVGGEATFNHKLTGWPLGGKHATTPCADCHKQKNKQGLTVYMGTDRTCGTCHAKASPHQFQRQDMMACERCHSESVWKPWLGRNARFNHDDRADAAMQLLGAHKPLVNNCIKCHPKAVFNLPAKDPDFCGNAGCHTSPHENHLFGARDCEQCHSPTFTKLEQYKFDHDQRTRFDLGPRHKQLGCYECHTKALGEIKPAGTCTQCHAKDNKHGARFKAFGNPAPACQVCHPSGGMSFAAIAFDHGRTKWPLTAKHKTACRSCHRGKGPADFERFDNGGKGCKECHKHEVVHASPKYPKGRWESAKCLKCHVQPGDRGLRNEKELEKEFHGASSDFPLLKKHRGLDCVLCHKNRAPGTKGTTFEEESPECGDRCHEDALHKGTLGKLCIPCHESGTWNASKFDHDKPFPDGGAYTLVGEHRNLDCEKCHGKARTFKDTPKTCSAGQCHEDDDVHKGRLGKGCEKCHQPTGDVTFNHNTMSKFRLDGKHLEVRCDDCHPSITFKPRPASCFGCHPEPTVHRGSYGTTCEQCHTTRTWEDIKPLHDVGDFALKGSHNNLACERCHRDSRPLAGSGNLCINCHRQDDIHNNSLSPRCGECHTQWSFAPARFDHSRVGCNLTGLHRTVACFDCHKNGNFTALNASCIGCHRDDQLRKITIGGTDHTGFVGCTGTGCHNPNTWVPGGTFARESVCR
jgi:hypothetical protein